ncbi:MAG: sce7726 family protein [Roseiarcus sp.]
MANPLLIDAPSLDFSGENIFDSRYRLPCNESKRGRGEMRDADVRGAVRRRLAADHYGDSNTRIVEEMGVWSSSVRIDIAIINGELTGVELKSDRDTLGRLPLQADLYSRVFDRVELVAGARHVQKAMSFVPDWWKITVATMNQGCVELADARSGSTNPTPDPYLVAQLLWKDEAIEVLESFGLATGWRSKRIKFLHDRLAAELPFAVLSESVRLALKRRDGWLRKSVGN